MLVTIIIIIIIKIVIIIIIIILIYNCLLTKITLRDHSRFYTIQLIVNLFFFYNALGWRKICISTLKTKKKWKEALRRIRW
jgi:uncharacterized membrane protein